jgi:hypothetical protein
VVKNQNGSDQDGEVDEVVAPVNKIVAKRSVATKPKKPTNSKKSAGKPKKSTDETTVDQEIESELSEEPYD